MHVKNNFNECVVPENIHTPTMEGIGHSRGVGGVKGPGNSGGEGGLEARGPDGRKSIDSLHTLDCATHQLSWDVPKFKVVKLRYF